MKRDLTQEDHTLLQQHFLELPADDKRNRFLGGGSDTQIRGYLTQIHKAGRIFGAFISGQLAGVGHLTFEGAPEIALSVNVNFRHCGVGSVLTDRAIACTRENGHYNVKIVCFPDNFSMLGLAKKYLANIELNDCGICECTITL